VMTVTAVMPVTVTATAPIPTHEGVNADVSIAVMTAARRRRNGTNGTAVLHESGMVSVCVAAAMEGSRSGHARRFTS
jgi:hypothetical protein